MNATEYIQDRLRRLADEFLGISLKYEYKADSSIHFVEVLPAELYHHDRDYAIAEDKIIMDFIKNFPDENICFITDDSYVKIENPSFVLPEPGAVPFSLSKDQPVSLPKARRVSKSIVWKSDIPFSNGDEIKIIVDEKYSDCFTLSYSPLAA